MAETLIERIDERLAELGLSERKASLQASGGTNADVIRDIRRKGIVPKQPVFDHLAEVLETTVEFLRYGRNTGAVLADRRTGFDAGPADYFGANLPRTLPVYGTVLGGDIKFNGDMIESHLLEMTTEIEWIGRPPLPQGRKDVYALYIYGSSMEPRYEPGEPVIVDPKRPPAPGDDVIVQVFSEDGKSVAGALIKRLVRRSASYIELRQYNPPLEFRVPIARVKHVHRVATMRDLLG